MFLVFFLQGRVPFSQPILACRTNLFFFCHFAVMSYWFCFWFIYMVVDQLLLHMSHQRKCTRDSIKNNWEKSVARSCKWKHFDIWADRLFTMCALQLQVLCINDAQSEWTEKKSIAAVNDTWPRHFLPPFDIAGGAIDYVLRELRICFHCDIFLSHCDPIAIIKSNSSATVHWVYELLTYGSKKRKSEKVLQLQGKKTQFDCNSPGRLSLFFNNNVYVLRRCHMESCLRAHISLFLLLCSASVLF